jgi:hypothetical protein
LGGKKLSSNQRRQLAFANKVITEGLTSEIPYVGRRWVYPEPKVMNPKTALAEKTAAEIESNYPGLLAPTLLRKIQNDIYKNRPRTSPNSQVGRMLTAAAKRARKIEGDVPAGQMRIPGAPPSRVKSVEKLSRVMRSINASMPDVVEPDLPYVYRGRSGWMGGQGRLWDSARWARAKGKAVPSNTNQEYIYAAKNATSQEREYLKKFFNEAADKWRSQVVEGATPEEYLSIAKDWSKLSSGAKTIAKNMIDKLSYTPGQIVDSVASLAARYDKLDDQSKEIFDALAPEWYDTIDELFEAVEVM